MNDKAQKMDHVQFDLTKLIECQDILRKSLSLLKTAWVTVDYFGHDCNLSKEIMEFLKDNDEKSSGMDGSKLA